MARIWIRTAKENGCLELKDGESAADALRGAGYPVPYTCGGKGTCGKCQVLADGVWQRACQLYPKEDVVITSLGWESDCFGQAPASEQQAQILTVPVSQGVPAGKGYSGERKPAGSGRKSSGTAFLAVDLGTTTIAAALVEADTGEVLDTVSCINSQNRYGADVLSRMKAAVSGAAEELQELVKDDICRLYRQMKEKWQQWDMIHIYVAANTAMEHLLLGESCVSLSRAPFTPVSLEERSTLLEDVPLTVLPGISAFVGADIAAGLLKCGFDEIHKPVLFLDLGTNGEMALGTPEGILATSAPAGPAFEGGNISCGTGSVPGAVCKVRIIRDRSIVKTIGDKPAAGLCGTGVLELAAELLDNRLVDAQGRMKEPYGTDGYRIVRHPAGKELCFTQQDMRELQMAKAAIRSGVELLIARAGIDRKDIGQVYLAGGFAYYLDVRKAVRIGLLPKELERRTVAVGNTSLQGCITYSCDSSAPARMAKILSAARVMNLAEQEEFEEEYIRQMSFET